MSALLCCGACFDTQNLSEDGNIYSWLDSLLTSSDDKVVNNLIKGAYNKKKTIFNLHLPNCLFLSTDIRPRQGYCGTIA